MRASIDDYDALKSELDTLKSGTCVCVRVYVYCQLNPFVSRMRVNACWFVVCTNLCVGCQFVWMYVYVNGGLAESTKTEADLLDMLSREKFDRETSDHKVQTSKHTRTYIDTHHLC